jgi:arginine exporter protein ArgO
MLAIFGGIGSLIGGLNYLKALVLVLAVMGGSLLWWVSLSELVATIRHKLTEQRFKLINRAAGTVLFTFGLILVLEWLLRRLH